MWANDTLSISVKAQRPLARLERGDGCRRHLVGRVRHLVPMQVREVVDALHDVPDVDGRRGRPPVLDLEAQDANVVGRHLGQQPVRDLGLHLAPVDAPAHPAGALGHRPLVEPLRGELSQGLGRRQLALLPLLHPGRRMPLGERVPGGDALLPGGGQG